MVIGMKDDGVSQNRVLFSIPSGAFIDRFQSSSRKIFSGMHDDHYSTAGMFKKMVTSSHANELKAVFSQTLDNSPTVQLYTLIHMICFCLKQIIVGICNTRIRQI